MSLGGGGLGGSTFAPAGATASVALNLTALMDILSNILFFLLASYSAEAVEVSKETNLQLPSSSSEVKFSKELNVTVSKQEILVAGVPVTGIREGKTVIDSAVEGDKIVRLYDQLRTVRASREAAGREGMPGQDTILLMADKNTDSSLISKTLKTAGMAGFVNVRFGVISK